MTDQYLETFVRESEERITKLNNALLQLEDDPDDDEAMAVIFRTAHTLKGNFGAMGFQDGSDLAHSIEDLLDAIRDGDCAVTPEVMDLIFDGVDQLERILGEIEERGEADVDTSETTAAIRAVMDDDGGVGTDIAGADTASDAGGDSGDDNDPTAGEESASGDGAGAASDCGGESRVAAEVVIGGEMPSVDGMLLLDAAREAFEVVETTPAEAAIEDGDYDGTVELVVAAGDPEAVAETLSGLKPVDHVERSALVAGGSEPLTRPTDPSGATDAGGRPTGPDAGAGEDDSGDGDTADSGTVRSAEEDVDPDASPDESEDGTDDEAVVADPDEDTDPTGETDPAADEIKSVRVDVDQLDDLHGLVEQLVTSRIKLRQSVEDSDVAAAADNLDELDKITANLQNTVMDMRLIPVRKAVSKFPRLVRDLAREQDKEIDFEMSGTDVELDRTILDEISDPLMHVIRNAVDHGIEPPAEREQKGKPREGQIRLRAERERDHVTIQVADDGAGLDPERLKSEALQEGVRTQEELDAMDEDDVYDLVYHPGFSTSEEVTDVSGRGVGMDVVHNTVSRLDGSVSVESEPDEGTTVTLELPVSVAIVKVLFVGVGDEQYGIPIKNIDEVRRSEAPETIDGREVVSYDDTLYPVVHLRDRLDVPGATANGDGMFVRIRDSERPVVLHCDAVDQQEEVVIKPFQGQLADTPGLSGTAVVGDGNVIPILDVVTL
ncbi:MAG: ATP-binding protein [Halobacteriaceae archaeon]